MNNTNFSWTKGLGFGVLIWAVMAVVLWILASIAGVNPLWAHVITALAGTIAAYLFAGNVKPASGTRAAEYGITWVAVILLLDLIVTKRFDAHIFAAWQYWLGSALVFLAPWVQTETTESAYTELT